MLSHEVELIEQRLKRDKHPNKLFFSYANTVATIDFAKQFKGHGWVGIKFQVEPDEEYNEITLHIRFKETDARLQQETLGTLEPVISGIQTPLQLLLLVGVNGTIL